MLSRLHASFNVKSGARKGRLQTPPPPKNKHASACARKLHRGGATHQNASACASKVARKPHTQCAQTLLGTKIAGGVDRTKRTHFLQPYSLAERVPMFSRTFCNHSCWPSAFLCLDVFSATIVACRAHSSVFTYFLQP